MLCFLSNSDHNNDDNDDDDDDIWKEHFFPVDVETSLNGNIGRSVIWGVRECVAWIPGSSIPLEGRLGSLDKIQDKVRSCL